MALLAFASQAQRWEWVKGYGTQASNGFEIIGTVTDNEDNLYFLGEFHTDAHWDGEPLLPSELYPGISGPHVIIAKISPTGDMVMEKGNRQRGFMQRIRHKESWRLGLRMHD